MAKSVDDTVLDGALNIIKTNVISMSACNAEPTTRAEAATTFKLAVATMVNGDFTIANGDTNGRKVTTAAKSTINVDTTGTATHVALFDATVLRYVTTCTSQALTSGNDVNFPAWDIEIADPT